MSEARRFLLDTHTLIWLATDDPQLSRPAREAVLDSETELFLSAATVWELAIKKSLGRIEIQPDLRVFVRLQLTNLAARLLDIKLSHVLGVEALPFHHRDPFDRLLVSTAMAENLTLLSPDPVFELYSVSRLW